MTIDTVFPPDIPSILIVDDAPANLELLAGMLREFGYEPRPIPSGKLALAAARADPPELILLDIRMPEMDGYEVCARLKDDPLLKDIPVIFLTALTETADKVKAFSIGAVDYVTKPFQAEEINARVNTHLGIRTLQRQLSDQNANLERLVAERTAELAQAYQQLVKVDQIKNDFLKMISHEIRTPVNGVLGIGELLFDLCPDSEERTHFAKLFQESSLRLRNLISDATTIANLEKSPQKSAAAGSFSVLIDRVRASLPDIQISIDQPANLAAVFLQGDPQLLEKALATMFLLAAAFSRDKQHAHLIGKVEAGLLRLHLDLNALSLSALEAAGFFEIESTARSASFAEGLGLAPVVAQRILSAFGGDMKLVKGYDKTGYLEAVLLQAPDQARQ